MVRINIGRFDGYDLALVARAVRSSIRILESRKELSSDRNDLWHNDCPFSVTGLDVHSLTLSNGQQISIAVAKQPPTESINSPQPQHDDVRRGVAPQDLTHER